MISERPHVGAPSHILLPRFSVAGELGAGRAVGQEDGHGVVVDLGEQTPFGIRRRSYDVS